MSRKSVLRNSGHIARAKEVVVVQPTLDHVPSKWDFAFPHQNFLIYTIQAALESQEDRQQ